MASCWPRPPRLLFSPSFLPSCEGFASRSTRRFRDWGRFSKWRRTHCGPPCISVVGYALEGPFWRPAVADRSTWRRAGILSNRAAQLRAMRPERQPSLADRGKGRRAALGRRPWFLARQADRPPPAEQGGHGFQQKSRKRHERSRPFDATSIKHRRRQRCSVSGCFTVSTPALTRRQRPAPSH